MTRGGQKKGIEKELRELVLDSTDSTSTVSLHLLYKLHLTIKS